MKKATKNTKKLEGVYCLPTSSKAHLFEPSRGMAFVSGHTQYLLVATQSVDEGGYPPAVVLSSAQPIEGWDELDTVVQTQHAENPKNLPPRRIAAIVDEEGQIFGDASLAPKGVGLPHWEFIRSTSTGEASKMDVQAVKDRITANKKAKELEKQAVRDAKSSKKTPAAA